MSNVAREFDPTNRDQVRLEVAMWLAAEWHYGVGKWPDEPELTEECVNKWVGQYIHRAFILGLDNPLGRQAFMKSLRTLFAFAEKMVREKGLPPPAGVPSGEILER